MPRITLTNLSVIYPNADGDRTALNDLSLTIENESLALLGPNGAGKSTLMSVIAGTLPPTSGSIEFSDQSMSRLGMVFQTPALDELLTVRENLMLAGSLYGLDTKATSDSMANLTKSLGLDDRLEQQVRHLSGGLKRRVDLARALIPEPTLLILDEPTTGLDVEARVSLWDALDQIRSQREMSVIFATHLTEEARRSDRVVLISDGELVQEGTPQALRNELGEYMLRVRVRDRDQFQQIEQWSSTVGCRSVVRGNDV
ncbi:MAG: ABC transporter ATP-binding protein, partial [Phycisphaerales bacterium]|nr:ABC transporter ATP-binding protein [Phycisphaerales bacterium]